MNKKITITIPVRVDTVERLENIHAVLNFLFQNGFQNIRVLEAAPFCNGFVKELLAKRINYSYKMKTTLFFNNLTHKYGKIFKSFRAFN